MGDWVLCRIFFYGEKTVEICNQLLDELVERGYIHIARSDPEKSIKYHVAKRLRELGILMHRTIENCRLDRIHRIYVADRKRMAKLRLEFDQLDRPWPICID
ncbi:hypothetical protein Pyrde_0734 [Pyrodictium delaneyi]|uniref:Uncharacterized protein n=1 Tax=Pyrodictium delaneyi TaxID=1273541 RepID=A0A0P0N2E1_9CREN|nr:hypothetical protein [Pyrodictium delaneyi]ALL00784.1 hypothetical protein Pyrde_0734 [Pyrodictium delaneyi]OWJ55580.1 hypothetical protein Pdsh_01990 [Pyrodictium delaneyi]